MPGVPGRGGVPPKRDDQRRRRNKPSVAVTKASKAPVGSPELSGEHSDLAVRFWGSLGRSGQSVWYQPSDWVAAELAVAAIDQFVRKPSAMMLASIQSLMTVLLVTEGDRRRLRFELEAPVDEGSEADAAIASLAEYRSSTA